MAWLVNKVMLFFCGNNIYSIFSKISALWSLKEQDTCRSSNIRVKEFMNVWSKLCGRQPLNILSDFKFLKAVFQILLGLFLNTLTYRLPINQRRVRPYQTSVIELSCKNYYSAGNYMFKVNNRNTVIYFDKKLHHRSNVVLVFLLLILNTFHTLL